MASTVQSRFQVCHQEHGLLYSCSRMTEAMDWARHWLQERGVLHDRVDVYDLMAHDGQVELTTYRLAPDNVSLIILGQEYKES